MTSSGSADRRERVVETQPGILCPSCDHRNRPERRFCAKCGSRLGAVCASCGTQNDPDEHFCGRCGAALPEVSPPAPVSAPGAARPRGDAPDALTGVAGERRQLTVVLCDLVGSTPLSQQLDPEEWRYVVSQYQKAATAAVTRFGGHVAKELGDGLLIYFGWPTARENDPERAIRAGLASLDAMGPLNARLVGGDGTRLAVRIGIHTGPVVIADGGEVFGETPNVGARVQAAAESGTVVVTAATQRLVTGLFVMEDRGP